MGVGIWKGLGSRRRDWVLRGSGVSEGGLEGLRGEGRLGVVLEHGAGHLDIWQYPDIQGASEYIEGMLKYGGYMDTP